MARLEESKEDVTAVPDKIHVQTVTAGEPFIAELETRRFDGNTVVSSMVSMTFLPSSPVLSLNQVRSRRGRRDHPALRPTLEVAEECPPNGLGPASRVSPAPSSAPRFHRRARVGLGHHRTVRILAPPETQKQRVSWAGTDSSQPTRHARRFRSIRSPVGLHSWRYYVLTRRRLVTSVSLSYLSLPGGSC